MNVYNNTTSRSSNRCWRGKAVSITYYDCVSSYAASKAHALYYIVICDMSGSIIYFHIIL